jgi:hypothetical protein
MKQKRRVEMEKYRSKLLIAFSVFFLIFGITFFSLGKELKQKWIFLNPEGAIKVEPTKLNLHPPSLEGKTVVLRWNGKHNGDKFLERVGELLKEKVKDIKIIKSWEVAPETVDPITGSQERSEEFARTIAKFKPDIVIAAQSD